MLRYRRLEKIQSSGDPDEVDFVNRLLWHQARIHGHHQPREQTWRLAENVWFDAVKLQHDLQEPFPEPQAMYYLTGLMKADADLDSWRRKWRRRWRQIWGK